MADLSNFQNEGVRFLAPRRAAILTDDAGLGKTAQFIRAADANISERLLIICQSISIVSWQIELPKWGIFPRPVFSINNISKCIPMGPIAAIVTYDWLGRNFSNESTRRKLKKLFQSTERFDIAILDEVQSLKSSDASRTRAAYGPRLDLSGAITRFGLDSNEPPRVWLGSATPTPNHVGEIFTHLRALFPSVLLSLFGGKVPTATEFEDRFCSVLHGNFGRQIVGNNRKTVPQLADALKPHWLGRSKRDVMPELGEIQPVALPVTVDPKAVAGLESLASGADTQATDDELLSWLGSQIADGEDETAPSVSQVRRELGKAKAIEVIQWIKNFLSDRPNEKIVVFSYHREVMDLIDGAFNGSSAFKTVRIDGSTSDKKRAAAVHDFQNDPHTRVFNGQIIAAGTSITLTAAHTVVIVEPDWTPSNNYQAICRCHRIGQNQPVTAYYAVAAGTLDDRITNIIRRKAHDAKQFTGKEQGGYL